MGSTKRYSYKAGPPFRVPETPTKTISFRLVEEELQALEEHAALEECSRSELLRHALGKCGYLTRPKKRDK